MPKSTSKNTSLQGELEALLEDNTAMPRHMRTQLAKAMVKIARVYFENATTVADSLKATAAGEMTAAVDRAMVEMANISPPLRRSECARLICAAAPLPQVQSQALEPVDGDVLPAVGSKVAIHLGRQDAWVEHEVTGYYVWGDLEKNPALHRVFVRVKDAQGYGNARLLMDVRAPDQQPVAPPGALADNDGGVA